MFTYIEGEKYPIEIAPGYFTCLLLQHVSLKSCLLNSQTKLIITANTNDSVFCRTTKQILFCFRVHQEKCNRSPESKVTLLVGVYEAIAVANFQTIDWGCTVSLIIKSCFDLWIEQVWCGNSQPHNTLKMSENNSRSQFSDNNCGYYTTLRNS